MFKRNSEQKSSTSSAAAQNSNGRELAKLDQNPLS